MNSDVWLCMRDGAGLDLGVVARKMRRSSCRRPSLTVRSKETFDGRGVSKEVGAGTWFGNWRDEEAIRNDVRAAEI